MDITIKELSDENECFKNDVKRLTNENQKLMTQNKKLEQRINELEMELSIQRNNKMNIDDNDKLTNEHLIGTNIITNKNGSAVSTDPLQQGATIKFVPMKRSIAMEAMSTNVTTQPKRNSNDSAALWKIIALCLLYRICSNKSIQKDSKNLPKIFSKMSQQTLRAMLQQATLQLPRLKAPQSQCLDLWWGPKQKTWNPAKIEMKVS